MNEVERIKNEIRTKRNKDTLFYVCVVIFIAVALCVGIVSFSNRYKPDPSLYVSYNLKTDILPEPIQTAVDRESFSIKKHGVTINIKKLASYDITGKVEAIKDYSANFLANFFSFDAGNMADYISPRDLTLTWGELSLDANSNSIKADQNILNGQRVVVFAYTDGLKQKYGEEYIQSHLSNNHIITLNDDLKRQLMKVKVTDIVRIKGYLVDVTCSNGYKWGPSSMTRSDHGLHSCEILYAEDIVIMPKNK